MSDVQTDRELAELRAENTRHQEVRRSAGDALRELLLDGVLNERHGKIDGLKLNALNDGLRRVRLLLHDLRGDLVLGLAPASDKNSICKPCPAASSVTGAACVLPEGHPADSPMRFHKYAPPKVRSGAGELPAETGAGEWSTGRLR